MIKVTLKNGNSYEGPIWTWRPKLGWFNLSLDPRHYDHEPPDKLLLSEVESGSWHEPRAYAKNGKAVAETRDLLEYARKCGWNPNLPTRFRAQGWYCILHATGKGTAVKGDRQIPVEFNTETGELVGTPLANKSLAEAIRARVSGTSATVHRNSGKIGAKPKIKSSRRSQN